MGDPRVTATNWAHAIVTVLPRSVDGFQLGGWVVVAGGVVLVEFNREDQAHQFAAGLRERIEAAVDDLLGRRLQDAYGDIARVLDDRASELALRLNSTGGSSRFVDVAVIELRACAATFKRLKGLVR